MVFPFFSVLLGSIFSVIVVSCFELIPTDCVLKFWALCISLFPCPCLHRCSRFWWPRRICVTRIVRSPELQVAFFSMSVRVYALCPFLLLRDVFVAPRFVSINVLRILALLSFCIFGLSLRGRFVCVFGYWGCARYLVFSVSFYCLIRGFWCVCMSFFSIAQMRLSPSAHCYRVFSISYFT